MKAVGTLIAIAILAAAGCSGEPEDTMSIHVKGAPGAADVEMIRQASGVLIASCPGLKRYASSTGAQTASIESMSGSFVDEEYGWKRYVHIELSVSSDARAIPVSFGVHGHTCQFRVGGGKKPGIDIMKEPCAALCLDRQIASRSRNAFVGAAEAAFIR